MRKSILLILVFFLASLLQGTKVVPLPGIYKPFIFFVHGDYIYIVEGTTISIFSGKDFNLINKFGKQGEGPQEFRNIVDGINFIGDQMVVSSTGRASFFTLDGKFIKEIKVGASIGWSLKPIGDNFVGRTRKRDETTQYLAFCLFDSNLKKIKEFHQIEHPFQEREGLRVFTAAAILYTHDNKIFISYNKEFVIDIFNDKGEKLPSIKREDYQLVECTARYKEAVYYYYKTNPRTKDRFELIKQRLVFPTHLSAIRDFYPADKKVYIRTYKQADNKTEFFIYDTSGKFIKQVFLPNVEKNGYEYFSYLYTVEGGKLYQLAENESTEEWELYITDIFGDRQSK